MKNVREFYDASADVWAQEWYANEEMLPCLKAFLRYLPEHPRVLDLCCGAGYDSMRLARLGADVVGLDFSEKCIEIARQRNPRLTFHVDDMLSDYSYIGQVDGIVCIAGLVHLSAEKLPQAFAAMARVLSPEGHALLVVRDGEGKLAGPSYVTLDGEAYDRDFHAHTLEALCRSAGGRFEFVAEIPSNEDGGRWKQYVFRLAHEPTSNETRG